MKRKLRLITRFILLCTMLSSYEAFSQTITGTITDQVDKLPLPSVNILAKGTKIGTVTDMAGKYSISLPENAGILVFTSIGYTTQEVTVEGRTTINLAMTRDIQSLSEVVVIGYGEKARGELTGSVATISGGAIEKSSQMNLTQSLQGKVPGLIVNNRGGIPGADDASILIRGKGTLGNNSPLIIIDGVPRPSFSNLSPNDIESVSVLKDAAAAIYGAQAANGVIIITTKRGKAGGSEVRVSSNAGVSGFTSLANYLNAPNYATWENEIADRYGRTRTFTDADIQKYKDGSSPLTHPNTDWYSHVFRDWAPFQHHNLSSSGGSENIKYFISGDYLKQEGLYNSKDLKYDQFQIRSNIDAKVNKFINLGFDLSGRLEKRHSTASDVGTMLNYVSSYSFPTSIAVYPNGLVGVGGPQGQNAVIMSSDQAGWNDNEDKIFQSKLSLGVNLDGLTKGLSLNAYSAFDFNIGQAETYRNIWTVYKYDATTGLYNPEAGQDQNTGNTRTLNLTNNINSVQLHHARLNYQRELGNHNISGFVAYEMQIGQGRSLNGYRRDLISETKVQLFTGGPLLLNNNGSSSENGRVNYFGSLSYNFKRKYLLDFTLRRDGSFNFAKDKRFGTFPGVSAAWNISSESFMASTNKWLSNLKLRASWAELGNDRVGQFQYLTQYNLNTNYIFGDARKRFNGFSVANVANHNITWEVAETKNLGLVADFWNGTLNFEVDYFNSLRTQILIARSSSVPDFTALALPQENLGKVSNKGVEMLLNSAKRFGEFDLNVGGNFTYNKNKVIYMDEPATTNPYRRREGFPIDSYTVYKTDGLFRTQAEVDSYPAKYANTKPGDVKYVDMNGDGRITGDDQVREYVSATPRIQYGFNLNINYKGFEVNSVFSGQAQAQTYLAFVEAGNKPQYLFDNRWTESNPNARYPRASQRLDTYNYQTSDFWLYDASFLRLNNVELAYNLSSNQLSKINVGSLRFYVRGVNLFTTNKIEGTFDPEITAGGGNYYPQTRTFTAGLNMSL